MKLLILGVLTLSAINLTAQFNPDKKYHPDSLKRWTKSVMDGISEKHPGFYRYTSRGKFDNLIDSTIQTINDSLTELEYYRKLKPLFAKIGCLHTGVSLSEEYQGYLDKTSALIPFQIFIDPDRKVLISKVYSANERIQIGAEVVSINGIPIEDVLNILIKAIPSDGFNQTEKVLLLNHRFPFWYQSMIEVSENFEVEIVVDGVHQLHKLKGAPKDVFPTTASVESADKKQLNFEIRNGTGVLTIHSFAKSVIKKNGQSFRKFTKVTFKEIETKGIDNLILDLRYNTGGTDGNAALLASYFFDGPFRYWDKIEVTEAIANEIKGMNRLFYRKPVKQNDSYLWRKTWLTREFDYYEEQKPARHNFNGSTYIITNGLCLSSCSDFVAVLSNSNKAKVIGQESGGGFQGNTSGMMPEAKIPTGLNVTVPLLKYTNAVDLKKHFGRGTIPDYEVTPTFENWINKGDAEMEFLLRLITGD